MTGNSDVGDGMMVTNADVGDRMLASDAIDSKIGYQHLKLVLK